MDDLRIALIGTRFMGRAHSNAYKDVATFFDLPRKPVMQVACGLEPEDYQKSFTSHFGWKEFDTSWEKVIERDDIDVVDICTSNASHMPIASRQPKKGKHVICEKPIARNADEARQMLEAARKLASHTWSRITIAGYRQ